MKTGLSALGSIESSSVLSAAVAETIARPMMDAALDAALDSDAYMGHAPIAGPFSVHTTERLARY